MNPNDAMAYSGPCQGPMKELFVKTVNGQGEKPTTIITKDSFMDVWQVLTNQLQSGKG